MDAGQRKPMRELSREADRIAGLILDPDYPDIDIVLARARLRERCEDLFPDRLDLFDMIYEGRFDRLWEQFREPARREA